MALVAVGGGGLVYPAPPPWVAAVSVLGTFLLDADGEKLGMGVTIPKTGTLNRVGFLLGTVTQAPASGLRVSFQARDTTTGDPSGTQSQFRDVTSGIATDAWIETGLITSDGSDTGVKRAVTAGDYFYTVVEFVTFGAGDSLNIRATPPETRPPYLHSGVINHFTTVWTKSVSNGVVLYLEYDDGTTVFIPGHYPMATQEAETFGSGSTPDEAGMRGSRPFKGRCVGAWAMALFGSDAQVQMVLYDTDGTTVLGSTPIFDEDWGTQSGVAGIVGYWTQGPQILAINSVYRAVVKPTTAATVTIYKVTQATGKAKVFDAWEGGQGWHKTSRTDGGAWTEDALARYHMGLIFDQLDDGAGGAGGGLMRHPGMSGGLDA